MTKETFEKSRERLFKNVEFNYFKNKPVTFRGREQWEVSLATTDAAQAEEWENAHLNVKHNGTSTKMPTKWTTSLNRKVTTNKGEDNDPVRIVDGSMQLYTEEERRKIGNGSRGNVIVWQGHYDNEHGKGISTSLTAMQIKREDLQIYEGGGESIDFDNLGGATDASGNEAEPSDLF